MRQLAAEAIFLSRAAHHEPTAVDPQQRRRRISEARGTMQAHAHIGIDGLDRHVATGIDASQQRHRRTLHRQPTVEGIAPRQNSGRGPQGRVHIRSRRERGHFWLVSLRSCRPSSMSLTIPIKTSMPAVRLLRDQDAAPRLGDWGLLLALLALIDPGTFRRVLPLRKLPPLVIRHRGARRLGGSFKCVDGLGLLLLLFVRLLLWQRWGRRRSLRRLLHCGALLWW